MSDERLDHGSLVAVPLEVEIHMECLRRLVGQKRQRLVERDRIRGQLLVGVPENEPPVRCIDHVELDHVDALTDPGGDPDARAALARTFDAVAAGGTTAAVVAASDRSALETLLRGPSRVLDLRHRPALAQA